MSRSERRGAQLACADWCDAPASLVATLYQAEIDRWATLLDWDASQDWLEVERGRLLGTVSGLVVTSDSGAVVGWAYFLVHDRTLQVGSFVSETEACTALMLEAVFNDPRMATVRTITLFSLTEAPGLVPAARRYGLTVNRYWYLSRAAREGAQPGPQRDARPWLIDDAASTAALLARAYGPSDGSRPFAPHGTPAEWHTYVAQLVGARGCGDLMTGASWCVPAGPGRLSAVALTSRVAPSTAHLVQLAVDPQCQGKGVGAALLEAAWGSAARAGCRRMTLLVSGKNREARRLYEGAGFGIAASFVSAGTLDAQPQPRRLTSVALDERLTTFR
jgi:ribosomal protein S18 acetylase RimI-like enzyme